MRTRYARPGIGHNWQRRASGLIAPREYGFRAQRRTGFPSGGTPLDFSYLTATYDTVDRSTYTYSSLSFGSATVTYNRYIIACLGSIAANGKSTVATAVTIGGVSASKVDGCTNTTGNFDGSSSIWIAAVPTGTSGDVVVTYPGTQALACVSLYRMDRSAITHYDSANDPTHSGGVITLDLNTGLNGAACYTAMTLASSGSGFSPSTGWTEDYDVDTASSDYFTSGSWIGTDASTPETLDVTGNSGATYICGTSASWET